MAGCCKSGAKSRNLKNGGSFLTSWGTGEDGLLCMELGVQLNSDCPKSGTLATCAGHQPRVLGTSSHVVAIDKFVTRYWPITVTSS